MKRNNSIIESKGGRLSMKYECMIEVEMKPKMRYANLMNIRRDGVVWLVQSKPYEFKIGIK